MKLMSHLKQINSSITIKSRSKRSLKSLFEKLSFNLEITSIDWSSAVGNDKIGASVGILRKNRMESQISLCSQNIAR